MLVPNFSVVNLARKDAFHNDGDAMARGIKPSLAQVKACLSAERRAKKDARTARLAEALGGEIMTEQEVADWKRENGLS